ncbi:hypothetical protein C9374_003047 [Naegleria lovaniensis]|uniref:G-patch domain-containing protein n=1 Tax=Naegleria lovaniensis TaxID=51637 RepID=A0AA88KKL6_NAELO|nr:uncharacterized protein C9374_003047 [Naegleria lovaniensis]KAG2385898.1 hypothetical protein C9374_003047 [Naegleria lovaniensis]
MSSKKLSFKVQSSERNTNVGDLDGKTIIFEEHQKESSTDERSDLKRKHDDIIPCKGNYFQSMKHAKRDNHDEKMLRDKEEFIPKKPVSGFGVAMLKGMGWQEGKPFGRTNKIVEPIEAQPRPPLAGLGSNLYQHLELDPKNKKLKEKLEQQDTKKQAAETTTRSIALSSKSLSIGEMKNQQAAQTSQSQQPKKPITWLLPNIYVRYINEGKYYLQKGVILDIPTEYECTLKLDSGVILEHVYEHSLETVIPKHKGTLCMVVQGKDKGFVGEMISKDREKETCQLKSQDDDIVQVSFDHCCEYREF